MLQNALDILRKEGKEILVCLSGSEEAQRAWLAAGGEAGLFSENCKIFSVRK